MSRDEHEQVRCYVVYRLPIEATILQKRAEEPSPSTIKMDASKMPPITLELYKRETNLPEVVMRKKHALITFSSLYVQEI
jgi:hypothetical protein